MTTPGFSVDVGGLAPNGPRYQQFADQVGAIHAELATAIDAAGGCWGDDVPGHVFARKYLPPSAQLTLARLGALADSLDSVAGGIHSMAAQYTSTEDDVYQMFTGLRASLE